MLHRPKARQSQWLLNQPEIPGWVAGRVDVTGLLSGALVGTAALTAIMEGAQARRVTRMSLPFMLGTLVTARRPLVRIWGSVLHFANGAGFASGYALLFARSGRAGWRLGAGIGALHGLVVLVAALPIIQEVHPRMAEEDEGPDPTPMLQPPGFLGLHYGVQTPAVTMAAHVAYGAIVGALYRPPGRRRGVTPSPAALVGKLTRR